MWAAKDKNGVLAIFINKPTRVIKDDNGENYWKVTGFGHGMWMYIDSEKYFPDLKWEDEPIEIQINKLNKVTDE